MNTLRRIPPLASYLLAAIVLCAAAACAQFAAVDTFNKRVTAGYTTVQTVVDSTKVAQAAGKLTTAQVDVVIKTAQAAQAGLVTATNIHATNPTAGENQLTATLAILQTLQSLLATTGVAAP